MSVAPDDERMTAMSHHAVLMSSLLPVLPTSKELFMHTDQDQYLCVLVGKEKEQCGLY
jgi:hypothetical protein